MTKVPHMHPAKRRDSYLKQVDNILQRTQVLEEKLKKIGNIFSDMISRASPEENQNADK